MRLDQLNLFLAVYRAGSFAPVAADMSVAPSSVSRAVAALEADLGVRLFNRTTRSLSPTEAGEAFYARTAPLVEELKAARQIAVDTAKGPSGVLRISASVAFGQMVLAPLVTSFCREYPDIKLEFDLSDRVVNLIDDRIDLAFRHGKLADSTLVARKLMSVRYLLVASPAYLADAPKLDAPDDLANHELIGFPFDNFRSEWILEQDTQSRSIAVAPRVVVGNASALAEMVKSGLGIGLLADWTVQQDLDAGVLKRVLPAWRVGGALSDTSIWSVYPSRAFLPEKTRAFLTFVSTRV